MSNPQWRRSVCLCTSSSPIETVVISTNLLSRNLDTLPPECFGAGTQIVSLHLWGESRQGLVWNTPPLVHPPETLLGVLDSTPSRGGQTGFTRSSEGRNTLVSHALSFSLPPLTPHPWMKYTFTLQSLDHRGEVVSREVLLSL